MGSIMNCFIPIAKLQWAFNYLSCTIEYKSLTRDFRWRQNFDHLELCFWELSMMSSVSLLTSCKRIGTNEKEIHLQYEIVFNISFHQTFRMLLHKFIGCTTNIYIENPNKFQL